MLPREPGGPPAGLALARQRGLGRAAGRGRRETHVYAKKTLPGAEWAFGYLARYMTTSALSRQRLVGYDPAARRVSLVTKQGEAFELGALELLERLLAHALPGQGVRAGDG